MRGLGRDGGYGFVRMILVLLGLLIVGGARVTRVEGTGRGAHEKTSAELKQHLGFAAIPTDDQLANSAWQLLRRSVDCSSFAERLERWKSGDVAKSRRRHE